MTGGSRSMLFIEVADDGARAIVAARSAGKVRIQAAVEHQWSADDWVDLPAAIGGLMQHIPRHPKNVVLVTSDARLVECRLSLPPGRALSGDRMESAVRWEIAPYLDFPAREALIKYRVLVSRSAAGTPESTFVLASCVARERYEHISQACREAGLRLRRVYPLEFSLPYFLACAGEGAGRIIALHVRRHSSLAMVVGEDMYLASRRITAGSESIFGDDVQLAKVVLGVEDLVSGGTSTDGHLGKIIVAAEEPAASAIIHRLQATTGIETALLDVSRIPVIAASGTQLETGAQFAAISGAALAELSVARGRDLGVDDSVSLARTIRKRLHILPLVVVLGVAAVLAAQYFSLGGRVRDYEKRISLLDEQRTQLGKEIDLIKSAEKSGKVMKRELEAVRGRIRYIGSALPWKRARAAHMLEALSGLVPPDVVVTKIEQRQGLDFSVTGEGLRTESIAQFAAALHDLGLVERADATDITKQEKTVTRAVLGPVTFVSYRFTVKGVLKGAPEGF